MVRVGVIGYGYWGPNLVRNFVESPGTEMAAVCDLRQERLSLVQRRYPSINVTTEARDLLNSPDIDAVAIATPVSTHFDLALQALKSGKHVLVEKPLTSTSDQARRLIDEAARCKKILMVDHTFIYTGAVEKMHSLITRGELGDLYYYDSVRVNLGLFQHDVSVIWDLAVHDLSILNYLIPEMPTAVSATGISHVANEPQDVAYLTLFFRENLIAHIHVNWLAPVKVRRTLIGGSRKMIVYDDLEPSEKVKVYDKGITINNHPESIYRLLVGYRSGDMWAPQLEPAEALREEVLHFTQCIENGEQPKTSGINGLQVIAILEAATRSMLSQGTPMEIQEILA